MSEIHSLLDDTLSRLRERMKEQSCEQIALLAGVGVHWLKKFAQGRIPNPTVDNLARLRCFLVSGSVVTPKVAKAA